jgi:hypothetical protein
MPAMRVAAGRTAIRSAGEPGGEAGVRTAGLIPL